MVQSKDGVVQSLLRRMRDPSTDISQKYQVLFALRNIQGAEAQQALTAGLSDPSALFRHEVAYCLGQRCDPEAIGTLSKLMEDEEEHPMVRHEAGEALGAIGSMSCISQLQKHQNDKCLEVAQTCQLAVQRIQFYNSEEGCQYKDESRYLSVDPAPAYPASTPAAALSKILTDENATIFNRYRALFALRNLGGRTAVEALGKAFTSSSALLKHEVAYVLGQMQDKHAVATLRALLVDASEDAMVRHEAAEALGAIADAQCRELLERYTSDPEPIVADSCIVASGMLDHDLSGEFQYAKTGKSTLLT